VQLRRNRQRKPENERADQPDVDDVTFHRRRLSACTNECATDFLAFHAQLDSTVRMAYECTAT
jgi:hypothetical protein